MDTLAGVFSLILIQSKKGCKARETILAWHDTINSRDYILLNIAAVDLFCGIGGLTHGLIKAGVPVIAGIDIDNTCKYAYEANNDSEFVHADITNISSNEINDFYPKGCKKILVGCAPCQPFSPHTQKNKQRTKEQDWKLLYSFSRLIKGIKPDIVSMENVYEISYTKVFHDFLGNLNTLKYHVSWNRVYCPDYGISQTRKRLVLLASRLGDINILPPTHTKNEYIIIKDVIGDLEPISAGEISTKDPLHRASRLNETNFKRIQQSKPGGTWRDWSEELISPCHKKTTGKSYPGVYARIAENSIGPTITTQFYNYGTGRFGHPKQDRALSLREGALLQTFPLEYDFIDPAAKFSMKKLGAHIGNAVPVNLGGVIGHSIINHLEEFTDA